MKILIRPYSYKFIPLAFRCKLSTAFLLTMMSLAISFAKAETSSIDFSGTWVPIGNNNDKVLRAETLNMTTLAKESLQNFNSLRHDSTRFCMPYGTPRNTLATTGYPIEILHRPEQLTLMFDRMSDVRRIYLDGRSHPDNYWPTWLGHSIGSWNDAVLTVDTVLMTRESILNELGLPHSDELKMTEKISLLLQDGEEVLHNEISMIDPSMYQEPIKTVREFRRATGIEITEGSAICQLDKWRQELEERNRELSRQLSSQAER